MTINLKITKAWTKILFLSSFILGLVLCCSCNKETPEILTLTDASTPSPTKTYLELSVGDVFPGCEVLDEDGNTVMTNLFPGTEKLILYSWNECGDCIENYSEYAKLFQEYDSNDVNVLFLWTTEIPYEELDLLGIPRGNNYSQTRSYIRFNNWVPTYFYLDEDNVILLKTTELEELLDFLSDTD